MPAQEAPQRLQPPVGPAHPVAQGRAVELDALPGEDLGLPVKRQVIGVLGHVSTGIELSPMWALKIPWLVVGRAG